MNTSLFFAALLTAALFCVPVRAQVVMGQAKRLVLPDTPQNARLADAVERLDLPAVQAALQNGASADAFVGWEGQNQQTPVAILAARTLPDERQKALPVFRLLITHVSNPNAADALGITLLTTAAGLSDLPSVTFLVNAGANVNARQTQAPAGATALHAALMPDGGNAEDPSAVTLFLLAHGADVNAADANGTTPLMLAAQFGKAETARLLLARGADVSLRDAGGRTALRWAAQSPVRGAEKVVALLRAASPMTLHEAAQFGDVARVRAHLDAGEDANAPDAHGVTPLMDAAKSGSVDVARLLLDRGADVNHKRADGGTALHSAALYGDVGLVTLLLDRGADINAARGVRPPFSTPLSLAVGQAQADIVTLLLRRGASIKNGQGAAALDSAIQNAGIEFVRRPREVPKGHAPSEDAVLDARWRIINSLLDAGVDVRAEDSHALFVAAREGQPGIMELLLKKGASINGRGAVKPNDIDNGATVLMGAMDAWIGARTDEQMVRDGSLMGPNLKDVLESQKVGRQCVERTLAHGANVNLPDARGTTPLMNCVSSGLPALADLLLAHGAKVDAADPQGRTALMRAAAEGDQTLAALLLAHGADINRRDKQNCTALMLAVDDGTNDTIRAENAALRPQMAPPSQNDLPNSDGHPDTVHLLLAHGANVHTVARDGTTALSRARRQKFAAVTALLTRAGAKR